MPYIGRAATNTGNVRYLDNIASGFDGSDVTFTAQVGGVSITPDQENVRIYLDGVFQHPGSGNAYTISGSTITFTEAPVANTVFSAYVVGAGSYLDDKAVTSAKLDDDAVVAAKLDDDGTGFQVGDLGVGGSLTSGDKLTVTGRLRASGGIIGDLTGDVIGDLTGNVTGNTSGTAATVTGGTQASITSAANLVTVGTIGTGVWNGTAVASAYLDADTAHLSTTQTFSGAKTFGDDVTIANNKQILGAADGVAYSFTGDTDTGIQSGGTNTIQITTAGSKAMDFDGNQLATFAGDVTLGTKMKLIIGSTSEIKHDDGSGSLTLMGDQVNIKNRAGSETGLSYNDGGGVIIGGNGAAGSIHAGYGASHRLTGNWKVLDVISEDSNDQSTMSSNNCFNDQTYSHFKIIIPWIGVETDGCDILVSFLYNTGSGLTEAASGYYGHKQTAAHGSSSYQGGAYSNQDRMTIFNNTWNDDSGGIHGEVLVYNVTTADMRNFSGTTYASHDFAGDGDRGSNFRPFATFNVVGYDTTNGYGAQHGSFRQNDDRHASYWKGIRFSCNTGNFATGSRFIVMGMQL